MTIERSFLWGCAASVIILVGFGVWLGGRLRRFSERRTGKFHNERGQAGERRAIELLRACGYRVRARHVTGSYRLEVDEGVEEVQLIADFIVERAGQLWVAEVKTGKHAPRVEHADTRRQMLEYQLAFGTPGVLLVDPEARRVRVVRFPFAAPEDELGHAPAKALVFGLASVAMVLTAWWTWAR